MQLQSDEFADEALLTAIHELMASKTENTSIVVTVGDKETTWRSDAKKSAS